MNKEIEEKGYLVVKNFLPKDFCMFIQSYFKIRQDTLDYTIDPQCPRSKSFYADPLIETLLATAGRKISDLIDVELIPTYSYARVYAQKEHLVKHLDRPECEYSVTICLGYPEDQGISSIFFSDNKESKYATEARLEIGDICIYKGTKMYHWREPFTQTWYLQAFLHYVDSDGPFKDRIYDGRLGLASRK